MFKKYKQSKKDKENIKKVLLGQDLENAAEKYDIEMQKFSKVHDTIEGFKKSDAVLMVEYSIRKIDLEIIKVLSDKYITTDKKRAEVVELKKQKHAEINRKIDILKYETELFKSRYK